MRARIHALILFTTAVAVEALASNVYRFLAAHSSLRARLIRSLDRSLDLECWAPGGGPCLKNTRAGEKPKGWVYNLFRRVKTHFHTSGERVHSQKA